MATSPDFKSGYDAANAAHKIVVDALEAQNAELRRRLAAAALAIAALKAPAPWWNVAICSPHAGEPWVWEPR